MPTRAEAAAPPPAATKAILEEVLSELGLGEERRFTQNPIAFLVDGDNASPELLPEMLAEASKYGSVLIRRVYGDWTSPQMTRWKRVLQDHALVPVAKPSLEPSSREAAREILLRAYDKIEKDDGLARLDELGQVLRRLDPSFDPRTYGEPRLVDLIRALPDTFAIERPKDAGPGELYVRRKAERKGRR